MKKAYFYPTLFLFMTVASIVSMLAQDGAFAISSTPGVNHMASIAFDGANYFVVWESRQPPLPRVYGAKVSPDGQILDPEGIAIVMHPGAHYRPRVAFDGENY